MGAGSLLEVDMSDLNSDAFGNEETIGNTDDLLRRYLGERGALVAGGKRSHLVVSAGQKNAGAVMPGPPVEGVGRSEKRHLRAMESGSDMHWTTVHAQEKAAFFHESREP